MYNCIECDNKEISLSQKNLSLLFNFDVFRFAVMQFLAIVSQQFTVQLSNHVQNCCCKLLIRISMRTKHEWNILNEITTPKRHLHMRFLYWNDWLRILATTNHYFALTDTVEWQVIHLRPKLNRLINVNNCSRTMTKSTQLKLNTSYVGEKTHFWWDVLVLYKFSCLEVYGTETKYDGWQNPKWGCWNCNT